METGGTRTTGIGGREGREASQRRGARGAASNDSGSRIPNGEAPEGGSPRAPGRSSGNGTHPRAFLGDTRGGLACGVCGIRSSSDTARYAFHVGQGATCSTLVVWSRLLREAQHQHHSAAQQSTAEPSTQDGTC